MGEMMKVDMFKLKKKDTAIVLLTLLSPLLFLAGFVFWQSRQETPGQFFYEERAQREFHGVIDSIYRQKDNHNVMTIMAKEQNLGIEGLWESKFRLGDSVSKDKGSLLVELYRNGDLIEILDYKDICRDRGYR